MGYQWKDKKRIPNPKETLIRRLIYEYFLEHQRKGFVANLLNQAGYRTRNRCKCQVLFQPFKIHGYDCRQADQGHHGRVALPFCHITLKAGKPIHREKYPDRCRTLGDWIRCRRIDLNLTKKQISVNLNVSDLTIYLWEKNRAQPSLAQIPKIIEFLGQDPYEKKTEKMGDRFREYRRVHGLTQRALAAKLGVDKKTLYCWERGEHQPQKRLLAKIIADSLF